MFGAIIGDIVGSRFEWDNYRLTYQGSPPLPFHREMKRRVGDALGLERVQTPSEKLRQQIYG